MDAIFATPSLGKLFKVRDRRWGGQIGRHEKGPIYVYHCFKGLAFIHTPLQVPDKTVSYEFPLQVTKYINRISSREPLRRS
jgi:hypothetical protein